MWEPLILAVDNLRANKLRSFLTMFGILWGVVSIVMLSAMGEGFRRGNHEILREFGKNIAIVWASRTGMQAGGERAGRLLYLTVDDARAIKAQSRLVDRLSPEIQRGGVKAKSAYNAATVMVHGIEPPYEDIRTIEVDLGRRLTWQDEAAVRHVCLVGHEISKQLFGERYPVNERITLNGVRYTVVGRLRRKDQDSNYSGPDNSKIFIPFSVMLREMPRTEAPLGALSQIIVTPRPWVVDDMPRTLAARTGRVGDIDWPLAKEIRAILARRKGFDPADRDAIPVWDTSLSTLFFDRLIDNMRQFFTAVGFITLALGGIGLMNIMLIAVKDRTREIGVRKALGATTRVVARQFFLEGLCLTVLSGGTGMLLGAGLCAMVNLLPLPARFAGMIVTWQTVALAVTTLAVVGIAASTLPARRAAQLPPTEALRYEM